MTLDLRIEKPRRDHIVEGFNCGKEALSRLLERYDLQSQQAGAMTTTNMPMLRSVLSRVWLGIPCRSCFWRAWPSP